MNGVIADGGSAMDDEDRNRQSRRGNVRTALILLSIAVAFFAGIVVKRWLFG